MGTWNAMTFEGKDTILRVVRHEAEQFFAMVDSDDAWEAPTGAGHWQVRDVVGHIVDTTEAYFVAFDAARSGTAMPAAYGLPGMAARVDTRPPRCAAEPRTELVEPAARRLRQDDGASSRRSTEDEWTGLTVPHFYMGPLPAFFYPAFQLMDYGVHSWDIRQGTGRAHGLAGRGGDLLVPFMFVLWKYTVAGTQPEPCEVGIRVTSGPNAGDTRVTRRAGGHGLRAGRRLRPDGHRVRPGQLRATAFGRSNAGTIRGDRAVADRYLNLFFRI